MRWFEKNIVVTDERDTLDVEAIHNFLSNHSYWAKGRPLEIIRNSIDESLCFGVFKDQRQIGFARVITDYSTFGYICDAYVLEKYRSSGIGTFLMKCMLCHPRLTNINWLLKTTFAQNFYTKLGFCQLTSTAGWMKKGNHA